MATTSLSKRSRATSGSRTTSGRGAAGSATDNIAEEGLKRVVREADTAVVLRGSLFRARSNRSLVQELREIVTG